MQNRAENSDPRAPASPEVVNARFQGHLDLVDQVARGFMTRANAAEHDDMLQEGRLALLRASESYRPELGVLFPAYAATAIRNALIDGARKRGRRTLREVMSLDAEQNGRAGVDETALRGGDHFADLKTVLSSLAAEKAESHDLLEKAITRLSDRHRSLIRQVLDGRTLVGIGEAQGVSKQAAAKAYHVALAQLKQELHALGVKGLSADNIQSAESPLVLYSGTARSDIDFKGADRQRIAEEMKARDVWGLGSGFQLPPPVKAPAPPSAPEPRPGFLHRLLARLMK